MTGLSQHVRRNAVAYLALFVALGGTGYAAIGVAPNSVGSRQIRNHVIDPIKFNPDFIGASIRAWVIVQWRGAKRLFAEASNSRVRIVTNTDKDGITWPHRRFPKNCLPSVTPQVNFTAPAHFDGYVTAQFEPTNRSGAILYLNGFGPDGTPRAQAAYVLIVCPPSPK